MKRLLVLLMGLLLSAGAWAANPQVVLKTNMGDITLELFPDKAPKSVENFLQYVRTGFYKGTVFHRVVNRFVIQGGGLTADLTPKSTNGPVKNEADNGLLNQPMTVAMARTYDVDSATSQFFINLEDNKFLNHYRKHPDYYGYTVFGKVVKGQDVVKQIGQVPTGANGPFASDVPLKPVVIEEVAELPQTAAAEKEKPRAKTNKRKTNG